MKGYVIYDPASGAIQSTVTISDEVQLGEGDGTSVSFPLPTGVSYVLQDETSDDEIDSEYYKVDLTTLEIVPKTLVSGIANITAQVDAVATITGLPSCTAAFSDDTTVEISDGELEVSCDLAGTQSISITSPLYLPAVVTFTVTE